MELTDQQKHTLLGVSALAITLVGGLAYVWFMFGKQAIEKSELAYAKAIDGAKLWDENMLDILKFKEESSPAKREVLLAKLSEMEKRLPSTREPMAFLRALDDVLNATGVITNSLNPGKIDESSTNYEEIPYAIGASSDYHSLGEFLSLVEDNPDRFMRVKTLKITQQPTEPSRHGISVGIGTFRFIEKTAAK